MAQNKVSEFHTEIERLDPAEIHSDIYIKHPIQIEQFLMEGNYNKVTTDFDTLTLILKLSETLTFQLFLAQSNIPSESYGYFIEILIDTVRSEIGSCLEKAYKTIAISEAQRLLHFKSVKELQVRNQKLSRTSVSNFFL